MKKKELAEILQARLPYYLQEYDIDKIQVNEVLKENGIVLTGLSILCRDENVAPCIYIEGWHERLEAGNASLETVLQGIRDEYIGARQNTIGANIHFNLQEMKDNIFIKAVNYDKNRELLNSCPHIRKADLAVTFRVLVNMSGEGMASALIDNAMFEQLDMSRSELYDLAKENSVRLFPARVTPLGSMLQMMLDTRELPDTPGLYVLTNDRGINGAGCMFYDGMLDNARKKIGDFYILPSSIHEVLLLKKEASMQPEELRCMVREINTAVVDEKEVLSDSVYEYDANTRELSIAAGRDNPEKEISREF